MSRISSQVPGPVAHWDSATTGSIMTSSQGVTSWSSLTGSYELVPDVLMTSYGSDTSGSYVHFNNASLVCHELAENISGDTSLMIVAVYTDTQNTNKNLQLVRVWGRTSNDNHSIYLPNPDGKIQIYRRDHNGTQSQMIYDSWRAEIDVLIAGYSDTEILNRIETGEDGKPGLVIHDEWDLRFNRFNVGPWIGKLRELAIFTSSFSHQDRIEIKEDLSVKWGVPRTIRSTAAASGSSATAGVPLLVSGTITGSSTVIGFAQALFAATGSASGSAETSGVFAALANAVGESSGSTTVLAISGSI